MVQIKIRKSPTQPAANLLDTLWLDAQVRPYLLPRHQNSHFHR